MVSINNNFHIKEYLEEKLNKNLQSNVVALAFANYLNLNDIKIEGSDLFHNCSINGFNAVYDETNLKRLFKCKSTIDGVPLPWRYDVIGLLGVKLSVLASNNHDLIREFSVWVESFLSQVIRENKFPTHELVMANYVLGKNVIEIASSPLTSLLLYYKGLIDLAPEQKQKCLDDFGDLYADAVNERELWRIAAYIFVFENIIKEQASVPKNDWKLKDLSEFLNRIEAGMNCWTWEETPKTKNSKTVKWYIDNEYHVQNLLYLLLAPIFTRIQKELNLPQQGHKNPRADLYLPEINTIIEVKYKKDKNKKYTELTDELAADKTLYQASDKYKDCKLIAFLWDNTATTEEYQKFKNGILGLGYDDCIVVSSPSCMRTS